MCAGGRAWLAECSDKQREWHLIWLADPALWDLQAVLLFLKVSYL